MNSKIYLVQTAKKQKTMTMEIHSRYDVVDLRNIGIYLRSIQYTVNREIFGVEKLS